MSFLTGKRASAVTPTQLNSINVDQSRYGDPVPLVYGVQRIPMTLLWYGAFSSTAQYSGGSGKGGRGPPSSYAYTASCVMGLCEGPIVTIKQVWKDKDLTTLATEGLTLFLGAGGQTAWPYLTSKFPAQAVPYDHTAYVAEANLSLGSSAALPNYTFEVEGFLSLPGTPITFTAGIAVNGTTATISGTSPIADGQWDITFSDNESRTCTVATTSGVTHVSWDSTLGLINAVTASAIAGGYDAEPTAVLLDYCTDANHGAGFNNVSSTIQGVGATTWQTYCYANGLFFSPWEDTQRPATEFVKDLFEMTNSNSVMSAGTLYVTPYGDSAISGNGRTFTPNLTPLFTFTDDDFMANNQGTNSDPVVMTRKPLTETYNVVRVEFLDRGNSYNVALAEWTDPLDMAVNGIRVMPTKTFHGICDARVAGAVAALIGQRQLYIRNSYQFTVRADYSCLEPMDLVAISDTNLGVTNKLLRITETEDDQNDIFTITAEEMFVGTATAPKYNFQSAQGYAANFAAEPFSVATPLIFSAPAPLVSAAGGYEIWVAAASSGLTYGGSTAGDYGGCYVFGSMDGTTYSALGQISGLARYGTISSGVTATATSINVTLLATSAAEGLQMISASASDYTNNRALVYVDGEIIGFETATLIGTGQYTLSPISRGLFGTGPSLGVGLAHSSGASWARLDEAIFKFPIDPGMIGKTVDLKLCAFNSLGRSTQPQSEATAYGYLITTPNSQPGTLTFVGSGVVVNGTSAFKSAATTAWDSSCWSTVSYSAGCSASCYSATPTAANGLMLGLTTNPSASNSYSNLNYAIQLASGNAYIYESGGLAISLGAITSSTLANIVYDGKHIAYYLNGVLVRSVPVTGLTLFMQICFFDNNATAYGIDFTASGTAVTPFTLIPMANTVACAGTKVVSNTLGTNGWGTKNFQSKESYSNGAICSASVSPLGDAQLFGFSTAPAAGAAGGYGPILAGWFPHGVLSDCEILFNGANLGVFGAYVSTSEVLTIAYDNFNFYWYRNNTLILQVPYPNAGPLYLFGDFYEPTLGFSNINIAPYSAATPQQFISRGNCVVSDTNVAKSGGSNAWDSDAYSINGFPTCHVVFKPNSTAVNVMVGLVNGAPPASPNLAGLNYALYCEGGGALKIYESGTFIGTYGTYLTSDYLAITYDGTTLVYSKNGITLLTRTGSVGPLFADVMIFEPGAGINSLEFGPSATIPILDTAQVGANAATDVSGAASSSVTVVNVNWPYNSANTVTALQQITYTALFACTIRLSATTFITFVTGSGATRADFCVVMFQDSATSAATVQNFDQISASAATTTYAISTTATYTMTAGQTSVFTLGAGKDGVGSTVTAGGIKMVLEAIKR